MRPVHALAASLRAALRDRRGATAIEYGLIISLIVVAMIAALQGVAGQTISMWDYVAEIVVENAPKSSSDA